MRSLVLVLALFVTACSEASGSKPAQATPPTQPVVDAGVAAASSAPRNFVCERVALINAKAKCDPEVPEVGAVPGGYHRARVTEEGKTASCALAPNALSMLCGDLFLESKGPAPAQDPKATKK